MGVHVCACVRKRELYGLCVSECCPCDAVLVHGLERERESGGGCVCCNVLSNVPRVD